MNVVRERRLALARQINELWYEGSGWLKAIPLCDLREAVDRPNQEVIDSYRESTEPDLGMRRSLIRLFLREWLAENLPEHIGTWNLDPNLFQPVGSEGEQAIADEIMRACLEEKKVGLVPGEYRDWTPRLLGRMPWYQLGEGRPPGVKTHNDPGEVETVPYTRLREWFPDQLFDPASAAYLAYRFSIKPTPRRYHHTWPHLIGMDRDLIGMLWLETG
jgi:hypothetical protein